MEARKYPLGLQDFEKIRNQELFYIDKTKYVHQIVTRGGFFFLSRPRRFGKSMFINTIQAVIDGKKELFKDLYIEDKWDWTQRNPIIRISFSNISHTEKGLSQALIGELDAIAQGYKIKLDDNSVSGKFKELIHKLEPLGKVVVLIDEYDKPILDHLGKDTELAVQNRDTMKAFYSILKDADAYLRLVFITGVTKFSKVSIFSELNNLTDLTMHPDYGGVCGITQTEMEENLGPELEQYDKAAIKDWYNGYTWDLKTNVYNPYSLLSFFSQGRFVNFWFETGTPSFLVNLMLDYDLYNPENIEADNSIISDFNIQHLSPISVLFQAGYVTLKDYDAEGDIYTLALPNREVRRSLQIVVLNAYRSQSSIGSMPIVKKLYNTLKDNDLVELEYIFNEIFDGLPYDLWETKREKSYHAIIHLVFLLAGIYVRSEVHTTNGRLDAIVELPDRVYLFEFKLDKSADEALTQIKTKGYANRFKTAGKTCIGIGINFIQKEKKVGDIVWEQL
jgi:hypothetical protein